MAAAAVASAGAVHASLLDGVTDPKRVTHRYEVECGSITGAILVEERFDRAGRSRSVSITSFRPMGGSRSVAPDSTVANVASRMARIKYIEWVCDRDSAIFVIHYLEDVADPAQRGGASADPDSSGMGRAYFVLDKGGLRLDGSTLRSPPRRSN
jgi:hypothetical protein